MSNTVMSLGDAASQMIGPVTVVSDFVGSASIIVGMCCLFAAFFSYMQYRVNPLATPLGKVFMYVLLGLLLLGIPFIYLLTGTGIPFPANKS